MDTASKVFLKRFLILLLLSMIISFPALLAFNFGSGDTTASLALSPVSGPVGTRVNVTGQGFVSESNITLMFASQIILEFKIAASQTGFTTTFTVPSITPGIYEVAAENPTTTVIVLFEVSSKTPTVTFSPKAATPGTTITITGSGFPKSTSTETYEVQLKGRYGFTEYFITGTTHTDSEGNFQYSAQALDYMDTLYAYAYKTPNGNTYTDYTLSIACPTFTVIPSLTLTPSYGSTGTNVTATTHGFTSLSTNRLMWTNTQLNLYTQAGTTQDYIQIGMHQFGFTTTFTIPNTPTGTYTVLAQQTYESDPHSVPANSKNASATFTITSSTATQTPTTTQTPPTTNPATIPTPTTTTPNPTTTTPTPTQTQQPTTTQTPNLSPTTPQTTPNPTPADQTGTSLYYIGGAIAIIAIATVALIVIHKRKTTNKTKP
jgi:hypothetical protein